MINFLKQLFTTKPGIDYAELIKKGAVVIDVRSKGEYQSGHIKTSRNIPLDQLKANLHQLKKDQPIILCCASGVRSTQGKRILAGNGFGEVYNGGGWTSLQNQLNK